MCCLYFLFLLCSVLSSIIERKLINDLFEDYEILSRPVSNVTLPVRIKLGMTVQQLVDVDEKDQLISSWNDCNLQWNPEKYENIKKLTLPIKSIWRPDVLLYNSVDFNFDSTYLTNAVLYHDSTINWAPPAIFRISCRFDITYFPFDEQICYFKFGAWTYDGNHVDIESEKGLDMSTYISNGEWVIANTTVVRTVHYYDCCPEPYPDIKFYITLRRRTLYYYFNLILPCILLSGISVIGFTLPSAAGEKITLQITVMLAIAFFLKVVTDMTPATSEALPLLGVFFTTCLFLVSLSVLLTMVVLNMHHYGVQARQMSFIMRLIFIKFLPGLLGMKRARARILMKRNAIILRPPKRSVIPELNATFHTHRSISFVGKVESYFLQFPPSESECNICFQEQLKEFLAQVSKQIQYIINRMAFQDQKVAAEYEWKFASAVADRLCLVILCISATVSLGIILVKAPYFFA